MLWYIYMYDQNTDQINDKGCKTETNKARMKSRHDCVVFVFVFNKILDPRNDAITIATAEWHAIITIEKDSQRIEIWSEGRDIPMVHWLLSTLDKGYSQIIEMFEGPQT